MTLKRLRSVRGFATAPVRVSRGGCSFQSGRASAPSIPQPVHTMRGPNVAPAPRGFFTVVCSALAFCPPAPTVCGPACSRRGCFFGRDLPRCLLQRAGRLASENVLEQLHTLRRVGRPNCLRRGLRRNHHHGSQIRDRITVLRRSAVEATRHRSHHSASRALIIAGTVRVLDEANWA
jgi:hypothetical protein